MGGADRIGRRNIVHHFYCFHHHLFNLKLRLSVSMRTGDDIVLKTMTRHKKLSNNICLRVTPDVDALQLWRFCLRNKSVHSNLSGFQLLIIL